MKKSINIPLLFAAALAIGACSDWTKPEHLTYTQPTPAEADPAGYRNYLAALREYKKSDHPVTIVTVSGIETPLRRNQHPIALPDSVDYVMVKDITALGPAWIDEMRLAREQKGTRFFCAVDYASIVEEWRAMWNEDAQDNRPIEDFASHVASRTERQLSHFDSYGFDGLEVSWLGNLANEDAEKLEEAFMTKINSWRASHPGVPHIFRGYLKNVKVGAPLLDDCLYMVMVPMGLVTLPSEMNGYVQGQLTGKTGGIRDRVIYEVLLNDPGEKAVGVSALDAASWAVTPLPANTRPHNQFKKAGLALDNAEVDYFDVNMNWRRIRGAAAVMNPPAGQ